MPRPAPWAGVSSFTFALLLALGLGARGDDWTQGGLTPARTSASAELSGSLFDAASWSLPPYYPGRIVSSPAVADGIVVVGTSDGRIQAARAVDGTSLWSFSARDGVLASPAIHKGRVYAPSIDGNLYALRLSDGALVWQSPLGGAGYSSPTIVSDTRLLVAVGFPQKKVMLVDMATGSAVWQTAPGAITGIVNSSAAVSGNQAIIGSMGGRFYALDLSTGAVGWTFDAPGLVNLSSPLIAGGTAYLLPGGDGAKLYAIDAATGAAKAGWPLDLADPVAPPAGTILRTNLAVSSPSLAGSWIVFQVRFDYYMPGAGPGLYTYTLREYAVGVNPATPAVGWMAAVGSKDLTNPNEIPELNLCATPAAFPAASGTLVAVSSSLESTYRVLDPSSGGAVLGSGSLSGPGRSSPVLANGRLFMGTDAGVLESTLSSVNRPPTAPSSGFSPANGEVVATLRPTLNWGAGSDPEGKPVTYAVRLGTGGEVLQNWIAEFTTGATQVALGADLQQGVLYTYAVRGRDPNGAWSEWSAPQTFAVNLTAAPSITVDGVAAATIGEAVAAVQPGGTIRLGKGTLRLVVPLQIPAGVSLLGVSAWETLIDARGLGTGIVLLAGAGPGTTRVDGLAVFGAAKNIEVQAQGAVISHVVLQGAAQAGLEVAAGGSAVLVHATVAMNSVGARSLGALEVRNGIVSQNSIGLSATAGGSMKTTYNDLFGNAVAYDGAAAGTGDLSQPVTFSNPGAMDYRLLKAQATTDAGDPADDASAEPSPNGGRVNLGAFGGTALAETSAVPIAASVASGRSCGAASVSSRGGSFPLLAAVAALCALFLSRSPRRLRVASRFPAALLLALFLLPAEGRPNRIRATKTWSYTSTTTPGSFSVGANWVGGIAPTSVDDVIFSTSGGWCEVLSDTTVASITIESGYSGEINNLAVLTVSGAFTQSGGYFKAATGTSSAAIGGNFTLQGGTFDIQGDLTFGGSTWDVQDGTIVSGAGNLKFNGGAQTFKPYGAGLPKDQVWVDDAVPAGAWLGWDGGDSWNWVTTNPAPSLGTQSHQSNLGGGSEHQHYFYGASGAGTLSIAAGDTLYCYVFLDSAATPTEVMLQWNDGSWEHRAYWGADSIFWGTNGTNSRRSKGALPGTDAWVRLEVLASEVGLVGSTLNGMAFTLNGGHATWANAGVIRSATPLIEEPWFTGNTLPAGAVTASDGGDSWTWVNGAPYLPLPSPSTWAHTSDTQVVGTAEHQHYFGGATSQLAILPGDILFAYIWISSTAGDLPSEIMLQWNDGSWEHRAYWGTNTIGWGSNGTQSRRPMGAISSIPGYGLDKWLRLEVPASAVGLEGHTLNGMAFTLAGGRATWDRAGRYGISGSASYNDFTVDSGAVVTLSAGQSLIMSGSLNVLQGQFISSGTNISIENTLQIGVTGGTSGTFTANATPVQVGSGAFADGVDLQMGTLNASSGLMTVKGRFTADPLATFNHNSGRVMLLNNGEQHIFTPPAIGNFNHLVINDTLDGYWNLNTTSSNLVFDSSGYARDGTGMTGTTPTSPTIVSGGGNVPTVNFTDPGSLNLTASKWVKIANPPPLASVDAITLAAWIKPTTAATGTPQQVACFGIPAPANGLLAEYYDNSGTGASPPPPLGNPQGTTTVKTVKFRRFDPDVNFGFASPPAPGIPNDRFMVAWTGTLNITTGGTYNFKIRIDDGARVWLRDDNSPLVGADTPLINSWIDQGPTDRPSSTGVAKTLTAGPKTLRIEFYENGGGQQCIFSYVGPDTIPLGTQGSPVWKVVPSSALEPRTGSSRAKIGLDASGRVKGEFSADGITSNSSTGTPVAVDATWTHIAGVLDFATDSITVYKDGLQVAQTKPAGFAPLLTTYPSACTLGALGSEADGNSNYFAGLMDEVRVYSRALTSQEISALAVGNQPMTCVALGNSSRYFFGALTLNVDGDLILNSSSLNAPDITINLGGSWLNHGGAYLGNPGTVNLIGNASGNVLLSGGQQFFNVNVNAGAGTYTLNDRLSVDNVLAIQAGTLNASLVSSLQAGSINQTGGSSTFSPPTRVVVMGGDLGTGDFGLGDATTTLTTSLNDLRIENPFEGNLKAYWKFDAGQGPIARDSTYSPYSSGVAATLNGGVTWTSDVPPQIKFENACALKFDGTLGCYAVAGPDSALLPASGGNQSVSLWFKYTGTPAGKQNFLTLRSSSTTKETNIGLFDDGSERVGVRTNDLSGSPTTLVYVEAATITSDSYHHLVYTFDGTTNRLYIDGSPAAPSGILPAAFNPNKAYFGSNSASTPADRFTGNLDDVRVYSRVLSAAEVSSLFAGRYPRAGDPLFMVTSTLGSNVNVNGTFDLDFGIVNPSGRTVKFGTAANVNGGIFKVDAGGATLDRVSTNYAFTVAGTAVLDISNLTVMHTNADGMKIGDAIVPATDATFSRFQNLAFSLGSGGGSSTSLKITSNSLTLVAPRCSFDTSSTYNVTLLGTPTGGLPKAHFESRSLAANGAGAQDRAIAEARTNDGDMVRNGVPEVVGNDGVVYWMRTTATDMTGPIQGHPTPAFNWTGFTWYATYVVCSGSGTDNDTIYVRDANGDPLYSFSVDFLTYGRVVGPPRWDQEGATNVLYVATSGGTPARGRILKFTDTGSALSDPPAEFVNANVTAITSPTIMDGTNIYFGGLGVLPGALPKVFAVQRSDLTLQKTIDTFGFTVRTTPSWRSISAQTYLFVGSDALAGQAHLYRIGPIVGATAVDSDNTGPLHSVNAATTVVSAAVHAGDDGGRMHGTVVASGMANLGVAWPYRDTDPIRHPVVGGLDAGVYPIRAMAYVDYATGRVYYGDWDLHFYVLNSAGALVLDPPVTITALDVSLEHFESTALLLSGKIAVGTTMGRVFIINESDGTISFTYNFGTTVAISSIAYSSAQNAYLVGTSAGQLFYITPR